MLCSGLIPQADELHAFLHTGALKAPAKQPATQTNKATVLKVEIPASTMVDSVSTKNGVFLPQAKPSHLNDGAEIDHDKGFDKDLAHSS